MAEETPKEITSREALLKEAEVLERQTAINTRLAEIYRNLAGGSAGISLPPVGDAKDVPLVDDIPIARLGIEDAVVHVLRTTRDPQKTSQIYKVLLAADYQFLGDDPMHAIQGAIKRLSMKANPDVAYVGGGKWTLSSLYTPAKLKKLREKLSGMGGASSKEHGRRTKEAMLAKGVRFGRRPKFGPDDIKRFRHLVEVENMRPLKALAAAGISTAYYYQYREQILAWKPGEPWPPTTDESLPRGVSGDELRAMGIIPLHAKIVGEE